MKSMFSKLPLSLQFNIAITISIILLTLVAGFVSIKLSSNALLHTQHLGLEKKIATTAELLSTPYQSLTPIVGTMANKLRLTFSGELSLTANERVNINGESVTVMKLNGQAITKDFTLVDQFTKGSQAPATIFQRVGDDFLRVSTSLKKQNGERAFGTWLGKKHPGYQQLLNGQPYQGYAKLFGKHFITQYEPVLIKGKVAAILFVGVDVSNSVQQAFDTIAKVKIGDTGYIYIIDGKGNMVLHPSIPIGTPFLNQTTKDGQRPFVDMAKTKSGTLRYLWQHKNGEYKEKYTRYEYAQDWDWIIVGGTYEEEFTQAANNMVGTLATTYILGTLIVVFVGVFTAKRLLQPLQNLEVKVAAVGQGELVKHGLTNYPTASQNEVHKIENSMHAMVTSLRQLINDAAEIGNKVNTISESVCQHAQGQQSTAIELNSASEQGATAIEEMSVSFREVAQSVTNTSDSARIVEQSTAETSSYMSTLLQSTAQMTTRINQVDDAIGDLSSNAANIQQAVELIRGVAEQTNLLALNAAIEAARAGEQGRGFAVVADEVRSLAQRTKRSTNEIEQVVEQFFVATEKAKHSMSLTLEETKVTNSKVNESNSLLNNVSNMVYNINNELDTISTAVTEQSAVSDDIAKRQNEVNQVAHSAAQQADQILHSASELSQLADDLSHSLAKFSA